MIALFAVSASYIMNRTAEFRTCLRETQRQYPPAADPKGKGKGRNDATASDQDPRLLHVTEGAFMQDAYLIVRSFVYSSYIFRLTGLYIAQAYQPPGSHARPGSTAVPQR